MQSDNFFEIANTHFKEALPFVLFRKPNAPLVKGLFQKDDTVYTSGDLTETGFVFAPFNTQDTTVLIPIDSSTHLETNANISEVIEVQSEVLTISAEAKAFHIELVEKAIHAIQSNALQKVVVSRKEAVTLSENNPIELFRRLLNSYQTAFVYCWYHPKIGLWLGATPEVLLSVTGKRFTTMALAGTQIYNETEAVNWGTKETEEQQLVSNFIVENLESSTESLDVGEAETVKAGNLLHLKTKISGTFNSNLKDIVDTLHPTPAVCGLPKALAKQFILENENYKREYYTGFLGELNIKEKNTRNTNKRNVENNAYTSVKTVSNLFVNLRCMQLTDTKASIYVGGGITKDSNPEKEWEETVSKTQTMKKVLF